MYEIHQRICLIADTKKKGHINDILSDDTYEVLWDNEDIEIIKGTEIRNEVNIQTPWARLANNQFDDYKNFTISSIINKVRNTSSNTISTLKSSKTIFKPYQFIPLLKLLNSERKRIIVADEVGLGKTISAGHIVLELASRGELKSMLVVCLNSIQEKWIDELQNKFNIRVNRFEKIKDFKTSLENARKFNDKIFGVINYDKFRQQKNIDYFDKHAIGFDLIIFDEAHALRNDTNARKSLKAFTELSNAIVMLTATPIMTSLENLYSLVKLLDEENYSNYQVFQNSININKPFIRAYNQLNEGVPLKSIAEELKNAEIKSIFKYGEEEKISNKKLIDVLGEDKLFQNILFELTSNENLTIAKRAVIQEKLINLNSLNHFYTRTRKKEVLTEGNIVHRNALVIEIEMSNEEEEVYDTIMNETEDNIGGIQVKRKYASSLFADNYSEEEYTKGINSIEFEDNKYNALIEIIKNQKKEKLIVFAFFRKTLLYLKNKLSNDGYNAGLIFGGIEISERNKIIDDFKNDNFQILLSSEVGSTGLDMQFCNRIVNYDLPWNPMVVEQRIGRIDRIGQQSKIINIFNFIYKNTIEEQIYHRLYDRIGLFKESLGNLDEILGETEMYIEGEIGRIYMQNLSKSDIEKRIDQLAYAIERNKLDLKKIDEGLKDSFSNDLYFENEIKAIEKNKQYLTEFDLVEFINRIIANKLTTFTFVRSNENADVYNINQPEEYLLFDFIEEYYDSNNSELVNIFKSFKTRNRGKVIKCTFDQEYAFANKNIEYISAYHPFINAISNFFHESKIDRNTTFKYSINRANIVEQQFLDTFPNQYYFLIKYDLEVSKIINGKISTFLYLKSIVLDLNGDNFSTYDFEQSDYFSSICQQFKTSLPEEGDIKFNEELMQEIKKIYTEYVLKSKDILEENEKLKFESELTRKTTQEITDINKRIERLEKNINEKIGIENILKAEILDLEKRKNKLQLLYNESKISVKSRLISLNYIYIYG